MWRLPAKLFLAISKNSSGNLLSYGSELHPVQLFLVNHAFIARSFQSKLYPKVLISRAYTFAIMSCVFDVSISR